MNKSFELTHCEYCEYYENGYCWGWGLPVNNVKECDGEYEDEIT